MLEQGIDTPTDHQEISKMKYLLFILLLLTGCFHYVWNDPSAIENPPPSPVQVAKGTDGEVSWVCQQQEVNESMVMIQCDFHNNLITDKTHIMSQTCIRISYYNEITTELVAESKKVCSGWLATGADSSGNAAFIKDKRRALQKCGTDLRSCVMLAGNDNL